MMVRENHRQVERRRDAVMPINTNKSKLKARVPYGSIHIMELRCRCDSFRGQEDYANLPLLNCSLCNLFNILPLSVSAHAL